MKKDQMEVAYKRMCWYLKTYSDVAIPEYRGALTAHSTIGRLEPWDVIPEPYKSFVKKVMTKGFYDKAMFDGDTEGTRLIVEVLMKMPSSSPNPGLMKDNAKLIANNYTGSIYQDSLVEAKGMAPHLGSEHIGNRVRLSNQLGEDIVTSAAEVSGELRDRFKSLVNGKNDRLVLTGFDPFDDECLFYAGGLMGYVGSPKVGKTTINAFLAMMIADRLKREGKGGCVVFISLEMRVQEVMERLAYAVARFNLGNVTKKHRGKRIPARYADEVKRLDDAVSYVEALPIHFYDRSKINTRGIESVLNEAEKAYGFVEGCFIDYAQRVYNSEWRSADTYDGMVSMMGELTELAKGWKNSTFIPGTETYRRPAFGLIMSANRGDGGEPFVKSLADIRNSGGHEIMSGLALTNPFASDWMGNAKGTSQIATQDDRLKDKGGIVGAYPGFFRASYALGEAHEIIFEQPHTSILANRFNRSFGLHEVVISGEIASILSIGDLWDHQKGKWKSMVIGEEEYPLLVHGWEGDSAYWWRKKNEKK